MQSIQLTLDFVRLAPGRTHRPDARCPGCLDPLTVHQPDVELPDRLLGVCTKCRGWFLVYATAGVIVRLPDQDDLLDA